MCTPEMKIRIVRPLRLKRDTEELTVKIFPDKEPDPETDTRVTTRRHLVGRSQNSVVQEAREAEARPITVAGRQLQPEHGLMGLGMDRRSEHNLARQPSSSSVRAFAENSGLDRYSGFPEVCAAENGVQTPLAAIYACAKMISRSLSLTRVQYLESLASTRMDLAFLTDADWNQVLAPLELKLGKARRVEAAIQHLRQQHVQAQHGTQQSEAMAQYASDPQRAQEQAEVQQLQRMMARNARPHLSPQGHPEPIRPADLNQPFIPVAYFQGEKKGWIFKHGSEGLGYYKDGHAGGPGGGPGGGGTAPRRANGHAATGGDGTGGRQGLSRGHDPISGAPLGGAQRRYLQEHEQALLAQRQQRLQQQLREAQGQQEARERQQARPSPRSQARAAAEARLRASPFATG